MTVRSNQRARTARTITTAAVAVLAILTGGAAVAPSAAAATTVITTVDDTVRVGPNHFAYTGTWRSCRCAGARGGSYHYTSKVSAKVRLTFVGTRATLYGRKQPIGGIARVVLDGRSRGTVNLASSRAVMTSIYTTPVLRQGSHTLILTVTSRTRSRGRTLSVDRAVVTSARPRTAPGDQPSNQPPPAQQPPTQPPPTQPPPAASGSGVASFTFDDGQIGHFTNAAPTLQAAGMRGTFYVISAGLGWGATNLNAAQVGQLVSAGHEVGSHTRDHAHLSSLSAAAIDAEFSDSVAALRAAGAQVTTCAYPYGDVNATVESIAAKYFTACRGTAAGTNGSGADRYALTVYYVHTSTTAAQIRAAADAAKAAGTWIIFTYHGVGPVSSDEDVTADQFASQVNAVKASGITVRTVAQEMAAR